MMTRLCAEVIAAMQGYLVMWHVRLWQDGWHPSHWDGYCEGLNGILLEVFVTDARQQAATPCERDAR